MDVIALYLHIVCVHIVAVVADDLLALGAAYSLALHFRGYVFYHTTRSRRLSLTTLRL